MIVTASTSSMSVRTLSAGWADSTISRNDEYQRGTAWTVRQQQMLVDSVLRGYPLPRMFFRSNTRPDVFGNEFSTLEVIDGQQRLTALAHYVSGDWPAPDVTDDRVALPASVKAVPVPWSKRFFADLPEDVQQRLLDTELAVVIIEDGTSDEVRDLFIRLQAGKPLNAQQVRDAWPGNVGPFIEILAGKLSRQGAFDQLFAAVDNRARSGGGVDGRDHRLKARETCAQLLALYIQREDRSAPAPLTSRSLDALYHRHASLDGNGPSATRFRDVLAACQTVVQARPATAPRKLLKTQLFSLFAYLHALMDGPVSLPHVLTPIAQHFWADDPAATVFEPRGRVGSVDTINSHLDWFLSRKMGDLRLPHLDRQRAFDAEQKEFLWAESGGACAICDRSMNPDVVEYDHIVPWILGGPTEVSNGRAVHPMCHARGLAALTQNAIATEDNDVAQLQVADR